MIRHKIIEQLIDDSNKYREIPLNRNYLEGLSCEKLMQEFRFFYGL